MDITGKYLPFLAKELFLFLSNQLSRKIPASNESFSKLFFLIHIHSKICQEKDCFSSIGYWYFIFII